MRKTLRLLDWIVNDIDEAKKKLEAVIDDDLGDNISIHAPLARCDFILRGIYYEQIYFNPRTSCEVRP